MQQHTMSHWDKHPYWTPDRRYLICFLTFGESRTIVEAAQKVQVDLGNAPVAICPPESLHQTMAGATTRDELSDKEVENIRDHIRKAVAGYPSDLIWLRREPDRYAWDLVERFPLLK